MMTKSFVTLPEDILLYILYQLKATDLFNLPLVSHGYNELLKRIPLHHNDFWRNVAQLTYNESRLKEVDDCRQLLLMHTHFKQVMANEIKGAYGTYFIDTKALNFFDTTNDCYRLGNNNWEKSFSLTQMATYLVEDNAEKFFAAISSINEIAAVLGQEYLSAREITKMIESSLLNIQKIKKITLYLDELHFIAMLPLIIKARAVRCFEIVIRAYFYLALYFDENTLAKYEHLAPIALLKLACTSEDDYFKKIVANITLRIVPAESPLLYTILTYYQQKGDSELVKHILQDVGNNKLQKMVRYLKRHHMDTLREALFPLSKVETLTTELRTLLTVGDTYLRNNSKIKAPALAVIQKEINEAVDALVQALQETEARVNASKFDQSL